MIVLLGEYESGDIRPMARKSNQPAGFAGNSCLPIPDATSIAGRIIRWYQAHPEPLLLLTRSVRLVSRRLDQIF
jgi:hypothetical protein